MYCCISYFYDWDEVCRFSVWGAGPLDMYGNQPSNVQSKKK